MEFKELEIPDLILITPEVFEDDRGFFMETWREDVFRKNIENCHFVQDNHSQSKQGVLRGLHYQVHQPQGKLVRVVSGEIFDVAVDIRKTSPTFGKWVGVLLTSHNKEMLWVPPGFAHGFYVLSEDVQFVYRCTNYYEPAFERTIKWNDPSICIDWPILENTSPVLSRKDKNGSLLCEAETL